MSRTIDAQQSPLRYRADMVRVNLVKLTTYTDRVAKTVDTVFYFAPQNTLYDYGNTSTDREFWPVLKRIVPLTASINHLPSIHDEALLRKPLQIDLSNEPYMGERLINTLRDGHVLEAASVELAQVMLADRPTGPRIDLSALDGDEHTVWYRGRVIRVGPISQTTISLQCEVEIPEMDWLRSFDVTKTEPDHIGIRVAKVYGEAQKIACVNWDVGALSTLADPISLDHTGDWQLSDATSFPSSGSARCGIEGITWTGKSGNYLTGIIRSVKSAKSNHAAGDVIIELIDQAIFLLADHEVSAIGDVYALNPYNGLLTRLTTQFTKSVADTTTVSGRTVASLKFTLEQLRTTLRELSAGAQQTYTPSTLVQRPIELDWETITLGGDGYKNLPALQDSYYSSDANKAPWVEIGGSTCLWMRFPEPSYGYSSQTIKLYANGYGGNCDIKLYVGRYDEDPDAVEVLSTTVTTGGLALYSVTTNEIGQNGWLSLRRTGGAGTLALMEFWREVATGETIDQQTGSSWTKHASVPESVDNLHDDNLSTYCTVSASQWVQVDFPDTDEDDYEIQRFGVSFYGLQDGEDLYITIDNQPIYGRGHPPGAWPVGAQEFTIRKGATALNDVTFWFETDLKGDALRIYNSGTSAYGVSELKYRKLVILEDAQQGTPATIEGASIGYGLRLFADVDGYKAPSASPAYKAGTGNLMTKPCDIMRHVIEELGGETIDSTSYDTCATNLGSDVWAFDLRTCGETWEKCLARLGFNGRATIVPEEFVAGTRWKMQTANSSYQFPAASASLTQWDRGSFIEASGQLRHGLASRFLFFYAPDWTLGDGQEAWTGALRATEDDNDLTVPSTSDLATAADEIGKIEAEPFAFHCIQQEATAKEIAGYYAHELIRRAAEFLLGGAVCWEAYAIEVGDIINMTPPWSDTPVKTRILEYTKDNATEQIEFRAIEVE